MNRVDDLISSNPFPGLRPFATSEADRFFGRQQQIGELVGRLDEVSFLAVTGSSGCGKSSLVRAGLLSELGRLGDEGGEPAWRAAIMRPGNSPIANLAEQLSPVLRGGSGSDESHAGMLYGRLRLGGLGLVEAVSLARLAPGTRVLVVVDQFEEIFRFQMTDSEEAGAFVKLLLNAVQDRRSGVSVVITLRSDALGSCADFRDLPETINRGLYLVPKLTREQRKEAIVKPVELRGFTTAPRLVQRLLNDVSDNFDDLPVMQHVLTRTWNRWAQTCQGDRPVDLEDYEAVGAAQHALSNHADEAYESLSGLEPVTEKVFGALTERIAEGAEVRRPLDFDRLCRVVGADRVVVGRVVERFRQPDTAFLMPPADVALETNPVIDISHESLIRQWQRLRKWAQADAESRALLLRLVEAARGYDAKQGSLWRGRDLARALEWQERARPTSAWVGLSVGGDGVVEWQSAQRFLARSAEGVRRERWRGRLQVAGVASLLLLALATSVVFTLAKQTRSRGLASMAVQEIDRPAVSARLATAALDLDPANDLAEYALRQSLSTLEIARPEKVIKFSEPVADARYSRDGARLVTGSGNTVTIFDTKTFENVGQPITRDGNVVNAWLIANNTTLVTQTVDGQAQIQRVGDPTPRQISCEGDSNQASTVNVSLDERNIALGCVNGDIRVWDVTDPEARPQEFGHKAGASATVTALAFSASEEYLASGREDGAIEVWKLGQKDAWIGQAAFSCKSLPCLAEEITATNSQYWYRSTAIRDISFDPDDPSLLVTASDLNLGIIWKLDLKRRRPELTVTKQPLRWVLKHERPVIRARFVVRADDRRNPFVLTVSDKTVRLWTNPSADEKQARGHDDWVTDANASADGQLLVTASMDGTARIWSTRSGAPVAVLRGHRDQVTRAVISPDSTQVATASSDRTVRVWSVRPPRLLLSASHWILSAVFEPHGTRIVVGEEGQSSLLDPADGGNGSVPSRHDLPITRDQGSCGRDMVSDMSWSRDGKLAIGSLSCEDISGTVKQVLWDVERKREITPEWLKESATAAFGPGTDDLLTVDRKGQIAIWDAQGLTKVAPPDGRPTVTGFGEGYSAAAMSPDGKWIAATRYNEYTVSLWRRDRPNEPRILEGHKGGVKSLQFSPDSEWLLTASSDRTACIWPVNSPGERRVLSGGHTAELSQASFDPSGKHVVTGSADSTIRVWDAGTLKELAVLRWHNEAVNDVEFSSDGKWILSASDDGTVRAGQCEACNLTVKDLRQRVRDLPKLSDDEREDVRHEIDESTRFKLPAFLSWHR